MEATYCSKQIIWAKVKGYPWWPAEIVKLPTSQINVFKVIFIAQQNHAYLHPKDVRKYAEYYDEFSKKKMRGLAPAIEAADQLCKKRLQMQPKRSLNTHFKHRRGKKPIYKFKKVQKDSSQESLQQSQKSEQIESQIKQKKLPEKKAQKSQKKIVQIKLKDMSSQLNEEEEDEQQKDMQVQMQYSSENIEQQIFLNQSQQKVDRSKIQFVQQSLYRIVEDIRQAQYKFNLQKIQEIPISSLSDEELLQSKITNMMNFIIIHLKKQHDIPKPKFSKEEKEKENAFIKQRQDVKTLIALQRSLKQRILNYLNDTTYYDQFIKLIQKNKKNRSEYECKLIMYLKRNYKIKKELSIIFASRLINEINNGTIINDKELLEDMKESRIEIGVVNNKSAIDRSIEMIIPKYM